MTNGTNFGECRQHTRHPTGIMLIVGHDGTNQMILRELLNLDDAHAIDQGNDEVYLIEVAAGHAPTLWKRVTTEHLAEF